YTYEDDDSNDLKLASSGGGGLAEITLTFDNGRVMYGFCSLKEATAALPRYILINWVGEDVPDARKCACASHVATVADFFQVRTPDGVEVIINASSLEDIDPMAIGQRLVNGTVAVASPVLSRLKTRDEENADVGTVYQKTNAEVEMKKINREEFWEQAKVRVDQNREKKKKKGKSEAKAIIAQRSGNPREFFKQKERAMTISIDASPVSIHRTGDDDDDDCDEMSTECIMAAVSPIPKIVTTPIKEDFSREEENHRDSRPQPEQKQPLQESAPTKPVQSVAPQTHDISGFSPWESETDNLVDLLDSSSNPTTNLAQTSQSSNLVDLMGDSDVLHDDIQPIAAAGRPQPLLSFDEVIDGSFCSGTGTEDDPSSLVDVTGSDQMTLSYQHALQHASGEGQDLDDGQLLMTNGETLLKEGTQASEGYFSQSQEEEFGQSEESSAKPAPIFYNKPPGEKKYF
uniref:Drebrin n=1 Tax=Nothobranchius furzeri TaxID=105023 RepID=A0A8C6P0I3_NOTFU